MGISEGPCQCQGGPASKGKKDNVFFSPLKGKMKVLKKIKRRMGLASRSLSNGGGTNNLPPLLFHNVHGENIRISRDGIVAKRVESFCKGIVFSSRPVKVNEKVCIKFLEISTNWSGVIRFGFTYNDPTSLRNGLPKYACPDLTNKPGYWAKALPERYCSQNTILHYYVTSAGDVHFGINGEEKGIFFSGVESRGPLWCLIDVYGNSTAIEFVDVRHQLNNSRCSSSPVDGAVDRILPAMSQLQLQEYPAEELSLPILRHQTSNNLFNPISLHRTRGRNVRFSNSARSVAYRTETEFCQGYVFTGRPLALGERIVVQILNTESMYHGCLGLGLTSCDPTTLQMQELPDDSSCLLDRPEYWVISKNFAWSLNKGDEVSFCISPNGEVQISRNGGVPLVVMHVDQSLRLWAFFDIYGSTQKIRVLSNGGGEVSAPPTRRLVSPNTANSESMNTLNSQSEMMRRSSVAQQRVCCVAPSTAGIRVEPTTNGGAVLSVIINQKTVTTIPMSSPHHAAQNSTTSQQGAAPPPTPPTCMGVAPALPIGNNSIMAPPTGTMLSTCSNTYVEPISSSSSYSSPVSWAGPDHLNGFPIGPGGAGAECTICYEHPIDAVLYMCGHMCMCYECALQQWRGKGGGQCPLCRAVIKDVIRTYKS